MAIVLTISPISEMAGPDPIHPLTRTILHELRSLGYVEGRNLIFERRSADGQPARYREIMHELIGLKTDVIVVAGNHGLIRAAQSATRSIPIVFMAYPRAVEDGFAASLARPGGNITGPSFVASWENQGKPLEVFKELVPSLTRVAYLAPKGFWTGPPAQPLRAAAKALGIELVPVEQHPMDPKASFAAIARLKVDGLFIAPSSTAYAQRESLGPLTLAARLATCAPGTPHVETGALMSYAPSVSDLMRKAARYVDRILKGANPAELPIEQPSVFELTINMKTVKALGLAVPPSVMLRADRLIE